MKPKNKNRMYGMIYRAKRKGVVIKTAERTIYRKYTEVNTPPCKQEVILMNEYGFGIQLLIE